MFSDGKRRKFDASFKAEAVRLCKVGDRSIREVAKDLDLTETAQREWVKRAEVDGGPVDTAHLLAGVLGDPTLASAVASLGVDVGALTRAVTQDAAPPEGGHDTFWPPWSADR